ncbi:zinc finger protein jing [Vespula squamosa]|uniref:Zinc finger protein jing n=1 Tax=Vespula squamosa TaxID=30214 RepID=A0ABD2A186_VESSQ
MEQEINISKSEMEVLVPSQEPIAPSIEATVNNLSKVSLVKIDDEEEEDNVDNETENPVVPFVLFNGKRRKYYLHLNNFLSIFYHELFSYSTTNGNIATSIATTYGSLQNG